MSFDPQPLLTFLFLNYLHFCFSDFDFITTITDTFTIIIYTFPFFLYFGTIPIPTNILFINMISDFAHTCIKTHLLFFYMTRWSKWQLQNAEMVLKRAELKCHFLCMVLNRLLFWTFINQRPSIFVSNHRQTIKDIYISLLSVPSSACVMYGWSVWIWVTGWVWKQVEAEPVIQSKLVSDTIMSLQNGLHDYLVTSSILPGWNTALICLKWPEVTHRLISVLDNESYYTLR